MASATITVLVVEDEPLVRMGIVDFLEDEGFTVLEAENSNEAIEILTSRLDVKILFTDIDMPGGIDGLKLSAIVRDRWPPIGIVVTSGKSRAVSDLPAGARFLPKPYDPAGVASLFLNMSSLAGQ